MRGKILLGAAVALHLILIAISAGVTERPVNASPVRVEDCDTTADLVPVVTDQTPLALSQLMGTPSSPVTNDNGDVAYFGARLSAVFYRPAGSPTPIRVMQIGDEVPGYPGSKADTFSTLYLNNSGTIAFQVLHYSPGEVLQRSVMTYNGSSLTVLVNGDDEAPGSGGRRFENISLLGLNDPGDIAFFALLGDGSTTSPFESTLYIKPSGAAPVRIIGAGEVPPGTTFELVSVGNNINNKLVNSGEFLFSPTLRRDNGSAVNGLFVASTSGIRKVFVIGEILPGGIQANGGTFRTNSNSEVVFSSAGRIWKQDPAGQITQVLSPADQILGGNFSGNFSIQDFNDAGDILFQAFVSNGTSPSGLFRKRGSDPVEVIAAVNQTVGPLPGRTIAQLDGASMNNLGTVSFRATMGGTPTFTAILQKPSGAAPLTVIAANGDPSPTGSGEVLQVSAPQFISATRTALSGAVSFGANVSGGLADIAYLRYSGGSGTSLVSNGDNLPSGSRTTFRIAFVSGAGEYVAFLAQRAGGRLSLAVHNIQTRETSILFEEGASIPGSPENKLLLSSVSSIFLADNGRIAFFANIIGPGLTGATGIFSVKPNEAIREIAFGGRTTFDGRTLSAPSLSSVSPSAISSNGTIVFSAQALGQGALPTPTTIYTWTENGGLQKVAGVGDEVAPGVLIRAISGFAVNNLGQVAFRGRTSTVLADPFGLYVAVPGTIQKIIAPGDQWLGTSNSFANSSIADINDNGQIAFAANSNAGDVGVFVGSSATDIAPVAINGTTAPGGGTYSMIGGVGTPPPNISINNLGDVVFQSDLTGTSSNSGFFVRRAGSSIIEPIALQGQSGPGTNGVFDTLFRSAFPEIELQLDNEGNLAFRANFLEDGTRSNGIWRVLPDSTVEPIIVRGGVRPEFGGGSAVNLAWSLSWASNARYPIWARVTGSSFTEGIFVSVPKVCNATPVGEDIPVTVTDSTTGEAPLTMTFDNVTSPGETTLTTSAAGPTVPTAFQIGDPPVFFNIETTATFSGFIEICLDISEVTFPEGSNVRLLHFENNRWRDITTSGPAGGIICGRTRSLSPFTVAEQTGIYDIDPPILSPTVSPDPVVLNGTATASANADDGNGTGVATSSCGPVDTSSVGTKSVTCTATDNEGNSASATVSYRVIYDFAGFFQPIDNLPALNTAKAGSSLPVKFSLAGDQGLGVLSGVPTSSLIACDASEPGSEIDDIDMAGVSGLTYDALSGTYTYVWKTARLWQGSCRMLDVSFIDGTKYRAKFRFK